MTTPPVVLSLAVTRRPNASSPAPTYSTISSPLHASYMPHRCSGTPTSQDLIGPSLYGAAPTFLAPLSPSYTRPTLTVVEASTQTSYLLSTLHPVRAQRISQMFPALPRHPRRHISAAKMPRGRSDLRTTHEIVRGQRGDLAVMYASQWTGLRRP